MTRRSNLTTAVYLLVVFLSGALVGVFAYRLYTVNTVQSSGRRTPEEYRRHYIEVMKTRLQLSPEQVESLGRIMDGTQQRYRELHERNKPELRSIEAAQYEQVRAMLNDGQRAEYEKMRAEREEKRRKRNGEKPSPPK